MPRELSPKEQQDVLNHPALPIATALAKLGYTPASGVWDAALRMHRTPDLARDLMIYVEAGQPAINYDLSVPKNLFKSLPHGYSIATLMCDFRLKITGAFLLASDLVVNTEATLNLLERFARDGVWITDTDGRHGLFQPGGSSHHTPAADTSDEISAKDLLDLIERVESQRSERQEILSPYGSLQQHSHCTQCGTKIQPGKKFCPQCGAKL
jgi:hypothetical protein